MSDKSKKFPPEQLAASAPPPAEPPLRIVGVGASAGGLESLLQLVREVALDHTALVVVQHLSPDHPSALASVLARETRLSVQTATQNVRLERNNIYVMPPDASLTIEGALLHMGSSDEARTKHNPVDHLLVSLARAQRESALGVVLSGTGSDGTEGMRAIKEAGGLTFVEDPATAGHGGMPQSVIDAGYADFVMTPGDIGREITHIVASPEMDPTALGRRLSGVDEMRHIFALVKSHIGTDLADYKMATLERRILRRMVIRKLTGVKDYAALVSNDRAELQELYRDMLINVTSFFRDTEAFERLQREVIQAIVKKHRRTDRPIRVWVVGCATGEEAYSVAICFVEALERAQSSATVQVFATDLSDHAVAVARRGVYSAAIAGDMSEVRLERFFVQKDKGYQVCRRIRDMVVLSSHNVLKDAPFSRIDLVTCRNMLIYLRSSAQKRALRVMHYALVPEGHLMLGSSETVGDAVDLFKLSDRKAKVYVKNAVHNGMMGVGPYLPAPPVKERRTDAARRTTPLQAIAEKCLLDYFCPAGVIVNSNLDIAHFRGHTGTYLDPIPGAASFNILRLARQELTIPIKRLASDVLREGQHRSFDTKLEIDGKRHDVCLHVCPLTDADSSELYLLILFEPLFMTKGPAPQRRGAPKEPGGVGKRLKEAQEELQLTKEYLQSTVEEKETAIEELKAANEELQSANEELQSTNEELETSKEEMQSANEELTTVNDELYTRMSELNQVNDDFQNVQASVENAIVIVGMDLRIRRYTLAAERLFNLVVSDTGREASYLEKHLNTHGLSAKISQVISSLSLYEEESQDVAGSWWALKISPYRTQDHNIRGAVISVASVDLKKRSALFSQDVGHFAARLYGLVQAPLAVLDRDLKVRWLNNAFSDLLGTTPDQLLNQERGIFQRKNTVDENLRNIMSGAITTGEPFVDREFTHRDAAGRDKKFLVSGSILPELLREPLLLMTLGVLAEG